MEDNVEMGEGSGWYSCKSRNTQDRWQTPEARGEAWNRPAQNLPEGTNLANLILDF